MLGEFLEVSLSTPDILASIEFYRKLGFSEAPAGSTWKHPYTVMTDGRLYIGLHAREGSSPSLAFVLPELRRRLPEFEALGLEFAFCNVELDQFNTLGFMDPDRQLLTLLEARTFSPVHAAHIEPSLCGYFMEYRLGVRDTVESGRFWETLGLIVTLDENAPQHYAQASWRGINIGLQQATRSVKPALVFSNAKLEDTAALLEIRGLPVQNDTVGLRVATPEGITLLLQPEEP